MNKTKTDTNYAPHFALFGVQLMFGTFPVVGKIALRSFPIFGVVAFRVGGAALAFVVLQTISGGMRLERRKDYFLMFVYAALGVVLNQLLQVKGLSLTTATNASLLAVMMPIFVAVISTFFGYDKLNKSKVPGILIAASGVIYLINPAQASFFPENTIGDLMIIANGFCYAAYRQFQKI